MARPADLPTRPLPLDREIAVSTLSRDQDNPVRLALSDAETRDLAAFLGVDRLETVSLDGVISPWGEDGWRLIAQLTALVHQTCGVTLGPMLSRVEENIERRFLPAMAASAEMPVELVLGPEDEDLPDAFTDCLDLGLVLTESLALNIDPYPRLEGAELETRVFAGPGVSPLTDEAARPFASLAALRQKMDPEKG